MLKPRIKDIAERLAAGTILNGDEFAKRITPGSKGDEYAADVLADVRLSAIIPGPVTVAELSEAVEEAGDAVAATVLSDGAITGPYEAVADGVTTFQAGEIVIGSGADLKPNELRIMFAITISADFRASDPQAV